MNRIAIMIANGCEEIEALTAAGARLITLGPRILRTETAGMAFLAMASFVWQDR